MISTVTFFAFTPIGRWMLAIGAVTAAAVTGFYQGVEWQKGKQAKQEVKEVIRTVEVVKQVQVGQAKVSKAYEDGRSARDAEFRKLEAEYEAAHRSVLAALPSFCDWNDDVVGLLNRARSGVGVTPDTRKPNDSVPSAGGPLRWETGISSPSDAAGRQVVFGLPGSAPQVN